MLATRTEPSSAPIDCSSNLEKKREKKKKRVMRIEEWRNDSISKFSFPFEKKEKRNHKPLKSAFRKNHPAFVPSPETSGFREPSALGDVLQKRRPIEQKGAPNLQPAVLGAGPNHVVRRIPLHRVHSALMNVRVVAVNELSDVVLRPVKGDRKST